MIRKLLCIVCLLFCNQIGYSQEITHYEPLEFNQDTASLPFRMMYPANFDADKRYPLILFLHGSGERGTDNLKQLVHVASFFASDSIRSDYPAFVVFPQCPKEDYWANVVFEFDSVGNRSLHFGAAGEITFALKLVIALLDSLLQEKFIDKSSVYVGGLSMGAMGTFEILTHRPSTFAAAFPVCGAGNPDVIDQVDYLRIWAFHGEDDRVVLSEYSVAMVEAYAALGADARLTIYPGVGHNAWDYAFKEPEFMRWLFSSYRAD
jgi:predicted peptidase